MARQPIVRGSACQMPNVTQGTIARKNEERVEYRPEHRPERGRQPRSRISLDFVGKVGRSLSEEDTLFWWSLRTSCGWYVAGFAAKLS